MDAVYRGMTQAELEVQYNAQATVGDITPFVQDYAALTAQAHRDLTVQADIAYGSGPNERFDLFPAGPNAPVLVFIHGGYWRALGRQHSGFMAKPFVAAGVSVAVVEYSLAPAATLDQIVGQVRAQMADLYRHAERYQIDRTRIFLAGSSAGAHLAAMMLARGWHGDANMPETVVKGALLASGLYDLEPVRLCLPNTWLALSASDARRNSPMHHLPVSPCPLIVTWGGNETDEFKRQSRDYASRCIAAGHECQVLEVSDRNHFDIITDLADPDRALTMQLLDMITDAGHV